MGLGINGGLVRVIPNAPDLTKVEGTVSVDDSVTARYGGNNHMEQAVINAPLIEDKFAVRVAAYRFNNAGYINNVTVSDPIDNVTAAVNAGAIAANQNHVGGDVYSGYRLTAIEPEDDGCGGADGGHEGICAAVIAGVDA
jgi:hypothetical protein